MKTRKNGKVYIHEELTEEKLIEISKVDMDLYKVLTKDYSVKQEVIEEPKVDVPKKKTSKK